VNLAAITLTHSQAWLLLSGAIRLEVAGTTSKRLSDGFTRPTPA